MRTAFGDRMWAANPDDVVRYRYLRRHCVPTVKQESDSRATITLDFPQLPPQVKEGELTFLVALAEDSGPLQALGPDGALDVAPAGQRRMRFASRVYDGAQVSLALSG